MIKNSVLILLIAGLFACNSSTEKETTANTSLPASAVVQDSAGNKLIAPDTATTKPVLANQLITPGKGIGHIMIDDDVQNSIKLLGKPDSADAAMGSSLMVWFAKHDTSGYRTSIFARHNMGGKDEAISHIQKILVTSPWFKTASHIGVGSTLDAIKKTYTLKPTSNYTGKKGKVDVYTDLNKGISFEINTAIGKCVGVVVHKAHDTAVTYINMH